MIVRHFGISFLSNVPCLTPSYNVIIEDDAGRQPLTITSVENRVSQPAGINSLKPNSKSSNEPNRKSWKEASKTS